MRTSSSRGMAASTLADALRSCWYRGSQGGGGLVFTTLIVGCIGEKPVIGLLGGVLVGLIRLPSRAGRWVMLNVSLFSSVPSEGAAIGTGVLPASSISALSTMSAMLISLFCMPTIGSFTDGPAAVAASADMSSCCASKSDSPDTDNWCRMDGRRRVRASPALGLVWRACGALGVVGDSGWEVISPCRAGSMEGSRSASRTGRSAKASGAGSMEGNAVTNG